MSGTEPGGVAYDNLRQGTVPGGRVGQVIQVGGSTILFGAGAPSNSLGTDQDVYINTTNGDYYAKTAGAWVLKGNLVGPAGVATQYQHTVTAPEIIAKQYSLSPVPTQPASVIVSVIGGGLQYQPNDFTISGLGVLSWSGKNLETLLETGDVIVTQY